MYHRKCCTRRYNVTKLTYTTRESICHSQHLNTKSVNSFLIPNQRFALSLFQKHFYKWNCPEISTWIKSGTQQTATFEMTGTLFTLEFTFSVTSQYILIMHGYKNIFSIWFYRTFSLACANFTHSQYVQIIVTILFKVKSAENWMGINVGLPEIF